MCDTSKCPACSGHANSDSGMFWWLVAGVIEALARAVWWLLRRVVKPCLIAIGWCAYVWCSGAQWRQAVDRRLLRRTVKVPRRWVRREVRATGQTLLVVVPALAWWQPVIVATVLAITGGGLVASALVWRNRDRLRELAARRFRALEHAKADARGPIRVRAVVGTPHRIASTREGN